jgi:hypothetical protein
MAQNIKAPTVGEILKEEFMEPLNISAYALAKAIFVPVYSGTLVKTKIDKFLNVSGSRHCSIEQQCREVALCWRDVPDG